MACMPECISMAAIDPSVRPAEERHSESERHFSVLKLIYAVSAGIPLKTEQFQDSRGLAIHRRLCTIMTRAGTERKTNGKTPWNTSCSSPSLPLNERTCARSDCVMILW